MAEQRWTDWRTSKRSSENGGNCEARFKDFEPARRRRRLPEKKQKTGYVREESDVGTISDSDPIRHNRALTDRGIAQREAGRPTVHLTAAEESVTFWRGLTATDPTHIPELANALTNLEIALSEASRTTDSLTAAEESVTLYRGLAADDPARFEETYRQRRAALQRAYRQAGLTDAAVRAHRSRSDATD
ncbi:MAG: hypothetical protein ACJ768_14030 [Gaiellaceae bacterium]